MSAGALKNKVVAGNGIAEIDNTTVPKRPGGYNTDIVYEFNTSYRELIDAGVDERSARRAIRSAYKYFDSIGGFK